MEDHFSFVALKACLSYKGQLHWHCVIQNVFFCLGIRAYQQVCSLNVFVIVVVVIVLVSVKEGSGGRFLPQASPLGHPSTREPSPSGVYPKTPS